MSRLSPHPSQRIQRDNEIPFTYRGKTLKGLAGDTVATALFSSGVRIFSRSLKYHRPRGLYNLDGFSSNCLMNVDGEPNVRACVTPLRPNAVVKPQNVLGTPEWDLMSVLQWFHFAMPAGFYYRVFHRPYWIWPLAQKMLRHAAGLGQIDPDMAESRNDHRYLNAEVCVIGGGGAGMQAALTAARAGVRVVLLEGREHLGGSLNHRVVPTLEGVPAYLHSEKLADDVLDSANIRVLHSTWATSIYQSNHITAIQTGGPSDSFRLRYYEIRAKAVVVAAGSIERPLIFENNDCPGIMQGRSAQQLVHIYGLRPGERAVVCGCHDGLLETAVDLAETGVQVRAVADARRDGWGALQVDRLEDLGIPFLPACVVTKARQFRTLKGVRLESLQGGKRRDLDCDLLVASAGPAPLSHLLQVAGAAMAYDPVTSQFLPTECPPGVHAAGRVLAMEDEKAIEVQARVAGLEALKDAGVDVASQLRSAREELESSADPTPGVNLVQTTGKGYMRFVCLDEDVTVGQVEQAMGEGFYQAELVKRYTAAGTGPSQGYLSGYNVAMVVSEKRGLEPGVIPPTRVRPPVIPTSMAALAGRKYHVTKRTPVHDQQASLGATFRLAGDWLRASHFTDEKAREEIRNVREKVGFIDISTLGKFRVHGPDALQLLQRVYVNDMSKVAERKLTYSVMCNEEGVVVDDGVVTKLGENDYFFTTSTIRAPYTREWLLFHSKEENWQVGLANLTDAYAALNLAGPLARDVLSNLTQEDVGDETLPFMGFRKMTICGDIPAMIARIGFVGEICYEIHVPASYGPALHDAVVEIGSPMGIQPFGLEAQSVLRLEKGHVIIVVDTDNHTTLHEIGLGRLWSQHKTDARTVGVPALTFAEQQTHREKLVGFMMEHPEETPPDGAIVVADGVVKGRVCTSRYSPTLRESIGMALVEPDLAAIGGSLEIYKDRKPKGNRLPEIQTLKAKVVPMPFYDPKGNRIRG